MESHNIVACDQPLKWIVEKPAIITWNDKDQGPMSIGRLSPHNTVSRLTMNIGRCPQFQHVLVVLHLPISIRSSRHPRDMFMIIPTDSISKDNLNLDFAPISSEHVASHVQSDLKNAGLAECSLFHIQFRLNKRSDVVMPQAKRTKTVKGTPKELMSMLKSLSESLSFDAYFRFDTYAQVELQKIFPMLPSLKTLPLNLANMYDGRGGGLNLWHNQGLDLNYINPVDYDDAPCEERSNKKSDYHILEASPPPSYLNATLSSPGKDNVLAPSFDDRVSPVAVSRDGSLVPETPPGNEGYWARLSKILNHRSPSIHTPKPLHKRKADRDSLPRADQIQSGHVAPSPSCVKYPRLCQSPMLGPPILMTETSASPAHAINKANLALAEVNVADPLNACDMMDGIVQWLYNAWTVFPHAHHDIRGELLSLGAAKDQATFNEARVECSMKLAFAVARNRARGVSEDAGSDPHFDAEEEVREVIRWINEVNSDADIYMIQDLIRLAERATAVADSGASTSAETEKLFLLSKAQCIATACLLPCSTK